MEALLIKASGLFGVGILTSLTPCVYPMIPISVGYLGSNTGEDGKKQKAISKVLGFVSGQITAFTSLGLAAVSLGEVFGFSSELTSVQMGTGIVLIAMAIFSFKGELPAFLQKWNNHSFFQNQPTKWSQNPWISFSKAFLVGAVSAFVASPCTGPMLGGVLTQIATADSLLEGAFLMMMYSVGLSGLFLILGLGLLKANSLPRSGAWLTKVHKGSSILLGLGGFYFLAKGFELL